MHIDFTDEESGIGFILEQEFVYKYPDKSLTMLKDESYDYTVENLRKICGYEDAYGILANDEYGLPFAIRSILTDVKDYINRNAVLSQYHELLAKFDTRDKVDKFINYFKENANYEDIEDYEDYVYFDVVDMLEEDIVFDIIEKMCQSYEKETSK